jgi:hypothetical protein
MTTIPTARGSTAAEIDDARAVGRPRRLVESHLAVDLG